MPATPIYALRYPAQTDPADVPTDLSELATDVEAAFGGRRYRGRLTVAQFGALTGLLDGDEVDVIADATSGTTWRFRYVAASASAFKWEFVGGPPLVHEIAADEGTSSNSYVDATTPGPLLTPPRAGDYLAVWGCMAYSTGSFDTVMALKRGAAVTADTESAQASHYGSGRLASFGRALRLNGLAATDVLKCQYRSSGAAACSFRGRWLNLTPIRIS